MARLKKITRGSFVKTNKDLIESLLTRNGEQSEIFCSPEAGMSRKLYRAKHPTEIMAFKCMDGRLNLSVMTKTPLGILQPFRNLGGKFDLGAPYLGGLIGEWVRYSISQKRSCIIFITYHWSAGDLHRGCRGFNNDRQAAYDYAKSLKRQVERVFGDGHSVVYPLVVGIETDEDALTFHGLVDDVMQVAGLKQNTPADQIRQKITNLYPDMDQQTADDLLPLIAGNLQHITELRNQPRTYEQLDHREQVLALGRGFDWLHMLNRVLIVGPYSLDLAEPIATAAGILLLNLKDGKIPKDQGVLLMTSGAYRDSTGFEPQLAREKSISMSKYALDIIERTVPELMPYLHTLVGTVDLNTRVYTEVK